MGSFRYPVEDIRARCDLVELISTYVNLKRSGRNLTGLCPFHNEKSPSFVVNSETQRYKCFGCGENGDVFSFLMRIEGLTFPEAVEQLAKRAGVQLERSPEEAKQFSDRERIFRINTLALGFFRNVLARSAPAREYLARRGMTDEVIERYRIGYAPEQWSALADHLTSNKVSLQDALKAGMVVKRENGSGCYDRFRDRIIFPILDVRDRIVGFGGRAIGSGEPKYLNSPETPVFSKNKTIYGLNTARRTIQREDCVIIVEGYMDAVTVQSAGFENAVATMGTALTSEHVNILSKYTQKAYLAFDSDSAGMKAALRSAPMFEDAGFNVRIIAMPAGHDPDSLLRGGDAGAFARLVESALPISDFRIMKIKEEFDLTTREGRTGALKKILPVLAEMQDTVERERTIRQVAPLHPNFGTGTAPVEAQLRQEAQRLAAKIQQAARPAIADKPESRMDNRPKVASTSLEKAEREVLGITIYQGEGAEQALTIAPDDFVSESAKTLATAVHSQLSTLGKLELNELAVAVIGTPAQELLNEILVQRDFPEVTLQSVAGSVKVIRDYRKKEKLNRFRLLADKVQQRQVDAEEIAEYLRLVKELKGSSPV